MAEIILEIPGIEGECKTVGFEKKISINSMSLTNEMELDVSTSNATRTVHTVKIGDVEMERHFDNASVPIIDRMIAGKSLGTVKIYILKASAVAGQAQDVFMTYTLDDTLVKTHTFSGSEDGAPTESIAFNFSKIHWEYKMQNPDATLKGKHATGFDVLAGKVLS
jgi:type VI secretion system secreted protein Hcp